MKKREVWLDALRFCAAFLVIVNHTNSGVFRALSPANGTWWLSVLWYSFSKIAVPVFVMVSGACLLGREDSWRKCFGRFARIIGTLAVFSLAYFILETRSLNPAAFLRSLWTEQITDSFWYLYFYAGLMLMLPMLQRLSCAMHGGDLLYLTAMCLGFGSLWPFVEHLVPALALPQHLDLPLFSTYIGLFFAGWWLRRMRAPSRRQQLCALAAIVLCMGLSVVLLRAGYTPGEKYWMFMDDRMHPGFLIVIASIAAMVLVRGVLNRPMGAKAQRIWAELGGCAFGVYLVQDWLIEQTESGIFLPLSTHLTAFPAVVLWELAVFAAALIIAWVLRRIPLIKKLV